MAEFPAELQAILEHLQQQNDNLQNEFTNLRNDEDRMANAMGTAIRQGMEDIPPPTVNIARPAAGQAS